MMNNAQILFIGIIFGLTITGICFLIANTIIYFVKLNYKIRYISRKIESFEYQINSLNKNTASLSQKNKK